MARVSAKKLAAIRAEAYPLERLPRETQERIAAQVAAPEPPARWYPVGAPDSHRPLAWLPSRGFYEWHWARGMDPDSARTPLPSGMRQRVIDRDGYVCQLCGGDVEPTDVHIDHIVPYSKGGPNTLANLQVAHSRCNIRKGARV